MSTSFYWFAPVDGDAPMPGLPEPEYHSTNFEHLVHVVRTAEQAGFEGVLIPYSFRNGTYGAEAPYIDTWTAACALGVATTKIRMLAAVLTGTWNPWTLARAAATLDHFTNGRLDLNIITGGKDVLGITEPVDHDTRYDRTTEFMECIRGFWSNDRFTFKGEFYNYEDQDCLPKPLQQPEIPLFFSGQSPAARHVARTQGIHTQLLVGETPEAIGAYIRMVKAEAEEAGAPVKFRFGIRLQVILGDTDEEAWDIAQTMLSRFDRDIVLSRIAHAKNIDASSGKRFEGLDPFDAQSHMGGENLWLGLRLVRPGATHAIVGSPESVKRKLHAYMDQGIEVFVLSGYPNDAAAELFGRKVLSTFNREPVAAG